MVSEGVDIPRLAVGVYATSASTPLFFAQAIGRFVRVRRPGETATVFLPSVPHLLGLASEMEAAARPRARRAEEPGRATTTNCWSGRSKSEQASDELSKQFEALSATAELDQVIFDGASFGIPVQTGTPEEEDYLGLPGLLSPDQVSHTAGPPAGRSGGRGSQTWRPPWPSRRPCRHRFVELTAGERRIALRRQLNALVAAHHHRTGLPHGKIHAELRRICGGPASAQATIEQLEERITALRTL